MIPARPNVSAPREKWMTHPFQKWAEYVSAAISPKRETWDAVLSPQGALTLPSSTIIEASYYPICGSLIWLYLRFDFEVGTAGNEIRVNLPAPCIHNEGFPLECRYKDPASSYEAVAYSRADNTNTILIRKIDNSNFTAGANNRIRVSGIYRIA